MGVGVGEPRALVVVAEGRGAGRGATEGRRPCSPVAGDPTVLAALVVVVVVAAAAAAARLVEAGADRLAAAAPTGATAAADAHVAVTDVFGLLLFLLVWLFPSSSAMASCLLAGSETLRLTFTLVGTAATVARERNAPLLLVGPVATALDKGERGLASGLPGVVGPLVVAAVAVTAEDGEAGAWFVTAPPRRAAATGVVTVLVRAEDTAESASVLVSSVADGVRCS